MDGDECLLDAAYLEALEEFAREVEAYAGSDHGAFAAGVEGLVGFGVLGAWLAGDVGGQGGVAEGE